MNELTGNVPSGDHDVDALTNKLMNRNKEELSNNTFLQSVSSDLLKHNRDTFPARDRKAIPMEYIIPVLEGENKVMKLEHMCLIM